jgi:mono/diheme cytochrome c family protein
MTRSLRNLPMYAAIVSCAWAADSQRGAMVLEDAGCLECHTIHGQGAGHEPSGTAPELGQSLVPAYTAPALASAVWNHTPAMLAEMSQRREDRPRLTAPDWEDLLAYLYSVQFLEFPAEVGRGKQAFQSKQCSVCHALKDPSQGPGKAVAEWRPLNDPVTVVYRMWSHSSAMELAGREAASAGPGWMKLDGRDFMDLSVYFQQLQGAFPQPNFSLPDPAAGKLPFDQNCGRCHAGPLALESALRNTTWMDIGAGMWNHVQLMRGAPAGAVSEEDMRRILAYVWELQYRGPEGDASRGKQTFAGKNCASCHGDRGVGKTVTPASLAAIGWGEGRGMHQRMEQQGVAWPHLSPTEVADLAAYMSSVSRK